MKYRKSILLCLIFFFFGSMSFAQQPFGQKKESRFVFMSSLGFSSGLGKIAYENTSVVNHIPMFRIHQVLAYQFNNHLTLGLGVGVDIWKKTAFIPLYIHFDVNFINRKITPLWVINAGYSFKWYESQAPEPPKLLIHGTNTGLYGETGLGIHIKMLEKVSLKITCNYTLQQSVLKYSVDNDFAEYSTNRSKKALYHFLGLKISVLY